MTRLADATGPEATISTYVEILRARVTFERERATPGDWASAAGRLRRLGASSGTSRTERLIGLEREAIIEVAATALLPSVRDRIAQANRRRRHASGLSGSGPYVIDEGERRELRRARLEGWVRRERAFLEALRLFLRRPRVSGVNEATALLVELARGLDPSVGGPGPMAYEDETLCLEAALDDVLPTPAVSFFCALVWEETANRASGYGLEPPRDAPTFAPKGDGTAIRRWFSVGQWCYKADLEPDVAGEWFLGEVHDRYRRKQLDEAGRRQRNEAQEAASKAKARDAGAPRRPSLRSRLPRGCRPRSS